MEVYELLQMQSLPLHLKIHKTCARIQEWYDSHDGNIYVAFSGGLDSTVLADITQRLYPNVPLVFSNTGMEYPEIVAFVSTKPNVTVIKPDHGYKWAVEYYGYPVISKATSVAISRYRTAKTDEQRDLRLHGGINPTSGKLQRMGVVPKKYQYLLQAPFKISDKCCEVLKKRPFKKYNKETGRVPMTGELAEESNTRKMQYLDHGCNFYGKAHKSTPMGFWTHQDVLAYILAFNVPYCSIYGDIIYDPFDKKLKTTGERQTGCYGCMFGVHLEDPENNRFTRMKQTHPERHNVCINGFGQGKVLDFMKIKY